MTKDLAKSSAQYVILEFLTYYQVCQLQLLSKKHYKTFIPVSMSNLKGEGQTLRKMPINRFAKRLFFTGTDKKVTMLTIDKQSRVPRWDKQLFKTIRFNPSAGHFEIT